MRLESGWWICGHACLRMREMRLEVNEVDDALADPSITYPSYSGASGQRREVHVCGRLAVVVAPEDRMVVTVLWHGLEGRSAA